ncbi:DUF3239 domain-containing protein [Kordia sp.]|uniref:DUF3239 domain-containing protein n=1 Tax=Kordia sp. TaxID=1965332 RepID=UPI003B5A0F6F
MSTNFTVGNDTFASNPGNANLNPFIWLFHDFKIIFTLSALFGLSIFLTIKFSGWFSILAVLFLAINIFYWLRKKEHFKSGDSNGGIVVSMHPTLVAVTTDLTKGFGEFPVVKIITCNTLKNVKIGDKIATVALYSASEDDELPHWIDFHPIPLSYATNNIQVLKRTLTSYDNEQWKDLQNRLEEIKKPYQEGLYKSEIQTSDWKTNTNTL